MRGDPLEREFDYGVLEYHLPDDWQTCRPANISSWGQRLGQKAKQQPLDVSFTDDAHVQLSVNALRRELRGEPYAGKPHVRFGEGGVSRLAHPYLYGFEGWTTGLCF